MFYERNGLFGTAGIGALLTAVAVLLGAGAAQPSPSPQPSPAASPSTSPAPPVRALPEARPRGPGRKLLDEFVSTGGDGNEPWPARLRRYELRILIATLPDPVDTHLDWLFDSNLDALKRAFESSGYVIDRFRLPWSREDRPAGTRDEPLPPRYDEPGALLFRKTSGKASEADLALLYVVGESPTSGVHRRALHAALEERRLLLSALAQPGERTVKILGPVFSGSADSLARVLDAWQRNGEPVTIRSGTATDPGNRQLADPALRRDFSATVHSDLALASVLCERVVQALDLCDSQVAVLKESTTQYGHGVSAWSCPSAPGSPRARKCDAADEGYLLLPFPMNISGLRAAWHAQPPATTARDPRALRAEGPELPLQLTAPLRPRENAPLFSEVSAPALDLQFDALAHVMAHRGVRLAAIMATDARDTLFLGAELRRRARDVQLATFEINNLYLRADYNDALRGMLVLSTYSLLGHGLAHEHGPTHGERPAFTSGGAQGTFNAALALLGQTDAMTDYHTPGSAGAERAPPVWIMTVGRNGFLPVAFTAPAADGDYVLRVGHDAGAGRAGAPREPPDRPRRHAPLAPLNFGVTVVLGIAFVGASLLAHPGRERARSAPGPGASFQALRRHVEGASLALHAQLYCSALFVALGSLYLPLAVIVARERLLPLAHLATPGHWPDVLLALFCLLVGARLIWCALRAMTAGWGLARAHFEAGRRYALHPEWPSPRQRRLWWLEVATRTGVAAAGGAYGVLVLAYVLWIATLDETSFRLFAARAQEIDGGVSPLLPLAFAALAFAAWSAWHLLRLKALRAPGDYERSWTLEAERAGGAAAASVQAGECVRDLHRRLFLTLPQPSALAPLLIALAVGAWLWRSFGRTIESLATPAGDGTAFEWLLRVAVLGSLGTTAWGVVRFAALWPALRRFLAVVGDTPLREAFERLPESVAGLGRFTLWPRDTGGRVRALAVEQLRLLERLQAAAGAGLEQALGRRVAQRLASRVRPGAPTSPRRLLLLRAAVEALWRSAPSDEQLGRIEAAPPSPRDVTSSVPRRTFVGAHGLWLRAAEEHLALHVANYVGSVLGQLRLLAGFLVLALVLTTVLLSSYPFYPQALAKLCFSFVLASTVVVLLWVTSDVNRNEVLSRIARTEPGRVTWDAGFVVNLVVFGVAPLLTLVSSEFPWFRGVFFAWVDPLLRALTKI